MTRATRHPNVPSHISRTVGFRRVASALVVVGALANALTGCVDPVPTPTPRPLPTPGAPVLRLDSWGYDGLVWTFGITVGPNGDPTTTVLEWGPGYVNSLQVSEDLIDPKQLSVSTVEIPDQPSPCPRFRATNDFGEVVLEVACIPDLPIQTVSPS